MSTTAVKKEAKATAKYVRISPSKVRRILDLIRGKATAEAQAILKIMPHLAARLTEKVLNSAIANAGTNHKLDRNKLFVSQALADKAFIMKRHRASSRGRGVSIYKRLSHICIEVKERSVQQLQPQPAGEEK